MKRVKKPVFFIIAAIILVFTYTAVFGVYTQNGDTKNTWIKGVSDIRWGIDIRGGVEATFSPADGVDATAEQLEAARTIIERRMVSRSITPAIIIASSDCMPIVGFTVLKFEVSSANGSAPP